MRTSRSSMRTPRMMLSRVGSAKARPLGWRECPLARGAASLSCGSGTLDSWRARFGAARSGAVRRSLPPERPGGAVGTSAGAGGGGSGFSGSSPV